MPQLPTAEEALGAMASPGLPTAEEALGGVSEGSLFSDVGQGAAASRILNAFTGSAARAFGSEPIADPGIFGLSKNTEDELRRAGVWNDYMGEESLTKTVRERTFKALAGTLATSMRAGEAALAAPVGAFGQFLKEIGLGEVIGQEVGPEQLEGVLTDPFVNIMSGYGAAGEFFALRAQRAANLRVEIPAARADGVIAEGEHGYFEAHPVTPENAQARVDAAREAGIPPPVPEPVAPDVHVLARRVNPPVFEQYDALEAAKGAHRETIHTLAGAREALPEAVQAQEEIRTILGKVHGVEERLTKAARARLEAAQARLDTVLSVDTPEMAKARKALLAADIGQRDLVPDVASAYRQAREMMPVEPKVVEAVETLSETPPAEVGLPPEQTVSPEMAEAVVGERVEPAKVAPGGPARTSTQLRATEGTGPLRTRTLSEGIEAKAIEQKLTDSFGDLPEYHQLSMAEQAQTAVEFIAKSPNEALDVAMGKKAPPRGLLPESVLVAVEKQAIAEGDVETLRRLATESKLSTAATTMGQRIRTLGERDATSPVGAIHAVQEARRAALEAKQASALKDATKEIKAVMRKNAPTRDAWASFIQEITCK